MKKQSGTVKKTLKLQISTIRNLDRIDLHGVAGGATLYSVCTCLITAAGCP